MRRLAVALTVLFVLSTQALAWHDGGHKIVAAIAFRQLTPAKQAAVAKLLKEHPRFNEEFKAKMPHGLDDSAKNEWIFQQAAVFPDIARQYSDDLKAEYHHPSWHYINMPEFLSTEDRMALHPEGNLNLSLDPPASLDEKSNVIQVIRAARKIIADTNTSGEDRALMLSWLFHTVGDIHQPLHSTAFFSRELFPHGDKGGNKVRSSRL
ncbi:MAG: S1/P1 nuclease [Planctomycetia bacterium]|nr:S1/P1 nuclease [Planctomycetia bacterium]